MNTNRPHTQSKGAGFYLLVLLIFFQAASGLYGGGALVIDPTGGSLALPLSLLDGAPFDNYLVPGLILFSVLGVFPGIVCYGLMRRQPWAWLGSVLVSIALMGWIGVEILMVGYQADPPLQLIYGSVGVVLLILSLRRSVWERLIPDTVTYEEIT